MPKTYLKYLEIRMKYVGNTCNTLKYLMKYLVNYIVKCIVKYVVENVVKYVVFANGLQKT